MNSRHFLTYKGTFVTEEESKELAAQLRKPTGEAGHTVAGLMNKGNVLLNRNTIDLIKPRASMHIVEVGMGNGKFVEELFQKFPDCRYSGCDYSQDMVNESQSLNMDSVNKGVCDFHYCDTTQLPFLNNSVDVIFTVNTIYFWPDVDLVLQEYIRVLKPNGQLLIGLRPEHLMKHYPFIQYGFNLFSETIIESHLLEQGFGQIKSHTIREPDFVTEEFTMPVESLVVTAHKK